MAAAGLAVRGSGICWRVRAADANDDLHDPGGRLLRAILVSARSLAPRTPAFWSDIARLARRGSNTACRQACCLPRHRGRLWVVLARRCSGAGTGRTWRVDGARREEQLGG